MAKKKTIKDVEVEEVSKKKKAEELEEKETEEVLEAEEEEEVEEEASEEVEEEESEETDEETEEDFEGDDDKEAPKKEKKKEKEHVDKKEGYFSKVRREMRKVVWPTFGEVFKYSFAVILFCVVLCLFFIGINALASLVKGLFS